VHWASGFELARLALETVEDPHKSAVGAGVSGETANVTVEKDSRAVLEEANNWLTVV